MLEFGWFTPMFVAIIACELALGVYVIMRDCKAPTNRVFAQYIGLAALCGVMDMVLMGLTAQSHDEALLAGRIWLFLLVLQMGVGYYLSTMVPFDMRKIGELHWIDTAIVVILAALSALMINDMTWSSSGWYPTYSWHVLAVPIGLTIFIILVVYNAIRRRSQLNNRLLKWQTALLTAALTIPADLNLAIILLRFFDIYLPRLFSLGFLATIFLIIIGVLRYQVFVPHHAGERPEAPSEPQTVKLVMGHAYLFESPSSDRMFNALLHEMGTGTSALIICRTNPDQLRDRYHLTRTPIVWLAEIPGPDRIDPTNLQTLSHMATEFVGHGPSIVAIEGIEYLIINNDLNKVVKMVGKVRDTIIDEGSIMLVSLDPRTLSPVQQAIFERELELVRLEDI
ncbi:MAG: DUF835 domain-containing protein [Methanomassiliicoccales archaeon]|nr:DUF835 domain-containing protein [Methanomassiliicoccales archaeon]